MEDLSGITTKELPETERRHASTPESAKLVLMLYKYIVQTLASYHTSPKKTELLLAM